MNGALRALALASLVIAAATLPACDRDRPQTLLTRGTPEATPTTARVLPATAAPSSTRAATLVPATRPAATVTAILPATATPSPAPPAPPTVTPLPSASPTGTPTVIAVPTATATPALRVHVVKYGETLAIIARKYATTATAIARLNGLANPNRIYVGQRLLIP